MFIPSLRRKQSQKGEEMNAEKKGIGEEKSVRRDRVCKFPSIQ